VIGCISADIPWTLYLWKACGCATRQKECLPFVEAWTGEYAMMLARSAYRDVASGSVTMLAFLLVCFTSKGDFHPSLSRLANRGSDDTNINGSGMMEANNGTIFGVTCSSIRRTKKAPWTRYVGALGTIRRHFQRQECRLLRTK
jgi:hypothetical protein